MQSLKWRVMWFYYFMFFSLSALQQGEKIPFYIFCGSWQRNNTLLHAFASFFLFIQRIHRYSFYSDPLSLSFSGITIFSSLPFSQTFLLLPFLSLHFFLLIKHFLLQFHSIPHKSLLILDFTITYPLCKNPFSLFQLPFHSIFTNLFIAPISLSLHSFLLIKQLFFPSSFFFNFIPLLTRVSSFLISQEHTLSARTRFSLFQLRIFGFSGAKMLHALFKPKFYSKW